MLGFSAEWIKHSSNSFVLVNEQMAFLLINQPFVSLVCLNQLPPPIASHLPPPLPHCLPSPYSWDPLPPATPPLPQLYQSRGSFRASLLKVPTRDQRASSPSLHTPVPMTVQLFTTQYRFIWGKAFKLFLYYDFDLFKLLSSNWRSLVHFVFVIWFVILYSGLVAPQECVVPILFAISGPGAEVVDISI